MANHLIIGLGGTGGKVLRELRKRVYEEYRSNNPDNGVNLNYIYVDSSPADLNDRSNWKVMGKSVHLGEAQKVNINGISASMLQSLNMYPGLQAFLNPNDKQLVDQHLGPLITAGIGGQRRRLGRMLLANNLTDANNPKNFSRILHNAVTTMQQQSGNNDVTFTVCAGLAGGTGSGSIVDVIAQIRKNYPYVESTHSFKIRLMLYMPEMNMVYSNHDAGFYHANGYAALQELNAMSVGEYAPYDITGEKDVYTQQVQRLLGGQQAFEAAYIYSNVNEAGKILELSKELPAAVADFLFQHIVVGGNDFDSIEKTMDAAKADTTQMSRLVGCENDGAGPESDAKGKQNRSRKFISFGITRVEYPESEIGEFVSYMYAIQASRQLTYNLWQEGIGYGECSLDEVGTGYATEIKNKNNREMFKLSNSYLTLGKAIVETPVSKKWNDLANTWENRTQQDAGLVQKQYEKKQWLAQFTKLADDYFSNSFRGHGVQKFYELQRQEIKGYARHLRRHIERILFDQWVTGGKEGKSILEIEKYATLLRQDCESRITAFKGQISIQESEMSAQSKKLKVVNLEWENIGWLKDAITNASEKVFASFKSAKRDFYIAASRVYAYQYAILLLQEIILELGNMIEGVKAMKNMLNDILDEVTKQAGSKCMTSELTSDAVIKKYQPEQVRLLTKQYIVDQEKQSANAAAIRQQMVNMLGEDGERTFANLFSMVDYETATSTILDVCTKNAREAMEDTAQNDPLMRMLGVNIIEKLRNELNTEDKLEAFVRKCIAYARTYVQFNPEETGKVINGNITPMMSMVQIALPKADSDSGNAFRQRLVEMFQQNVPGFSPVQDVSISPDSNRMVVVCANAGIPLRNLLNMKTLKEKYDKLLAAPDKDLNRMVLHTESLDNPLPPLFEKTLVDIEQENEPAKYLMLGLALNLILPQSNPVTGAKFLALGIEDPIFGTQWNELGKDFLGCLAVLKDDRMKKETLKRQVIQALAIQCVSNEQKQAVTMKIGQIVQQVILPTVCGGNQFDEKYGEFRVLAQKIIAEELKQL